MFVYFAEPIDQDNGSNYVECEFRKTMIIHLLGQGHSVFRPATAFELGKVDQYTSLRVEKINRTALAEADILVARLPEGVPSVGVPMEIEHATRVLGIPALVVGTAGVALQGNDLVTLVPGSNMHQFTQTFNAMAGNTKRAKPQMRHVGHLTPRTYPGDAGIDLVTSRETIIPAHGTARVPTGNRIEFPEGMWGWIVSRSSTFENFGVQILPGIIDTGYTGELFANALNLDDLPKIIPAGSRLCQIILFENATARYQPVQVEKIEERDRGSNGFGSTGRNGHFLNNSPDRITLG